MPETTWVAIILAVIGVLHGPGTQAILARVASRKGKK